MRTGEAVKRHEDIQHAAAYGVGARVLAHGGAQYAWAKRLIVLIAVGSSSASLMSISSASAFFGTTRRASALALGDHHLAAERVALRQAEQRPHALWDRRPLPARHRPTG